MTENRNHVNKLSRALGRLQGTLESIEISAESAMKHFDQVELLKTRLEEISDIAKTGLVMAEQIMGYPMDASDPKTILLRCGHRVPRRPEIKILRNSRIHCSACGGGVLPDHREFPSE